jgi:hypothetical protein
MEHNSVYVFYKKVVEYLSLREERIIIDENVCANMAKWLKRIRYTVSHDDIYELSICCCIIDRIRLRISQIDIIEFENQCARIYNLFKCTNDYQAVLDELSVAYSCGTAKYKNVSTSVKSIIEKWDKNEDEDITTLYEKMSDTFKLYSEKCREPLVKYVMYVYNNVFSADMHDIHAKALTKYATNIDNYDPLYSIIMTCIQELEYSWPMYIYSQCVRIDLNDIAGAIRRFKQLSPHANRIMYSLSKRKQADILELKNKIHSLMVE